MLTKPLMATTLGLLVAIPAGPVIAKDSRAEVRTAGQCTGAATWKLKVKQDDAGVEVEFEVDANVVGQAWDHTLSGPSGLLSSGTRTTTAPSGSFSVEVMAAGAITDAFKGVATFNGQTCDTSIVMPVSPGPQPTDDNPKGDDTPGSDDNPKADDNPKGDGTPRADDNPKGDDTPGSDDNPKADDNPRGDDTAAGLCTDDSATAALRSKRRKATLRVDSDSRGELWRYEIRRDGKVVKSGTARTKGSKGVFKVSAKSRAAGAFTATATKVGSDDSCEIAS